ncbi:S41 family peptidase [Mucilaginibacter sp. BT774]|uniref:S41 family peptidase n=1 Tax=Mucilaginibacter sp. BT774 TaxID=3062276 RepID=UPI002674B29B|nr:S41 family peptidase [Mucilaginibacter sp. BT774]MDO3626523.1 S41 family peptidase [Mucilaginibacter sp. BT774]
MKQKKRIIFQAALYAPIAFLITSCKTPIDNKVVNPDTVTQKIAVKDMHDDLSVLWSAIKELHPGYGIYTPPDTLQKVYNKTYNSINAPLSEAEFVDHVYPFLCQLRCGHTQIEHSAGYKAVSAAHLPFEVLVKHHRAWITTSQTPELVTGDEIVKINNIPVSEVISHGYDLYCGDGYNETFKELFLSEYDGFEDACNKYYHWTGPYQITLRTKQGEVKAITANPITGNSSQTQAVKQIDNYADWTEAKNTGRLPLRFLNNSSTALFTVKTFEYGDTLIYKEAFRQIRHKVIKNLIIDIRHNTGGDIRIAIQLLSYLADAPYNIINDAKSRIPNPALNHFAKYFDTSRTGGFNQGFQAGNKEGTWYHVDTKPVFGKVYGSLPLSKTDHFEGNLFVLIDGATFSSGALFTSALKAQRRNVKFIGRETAGAEEGCNGMTIQKLTLPNTKIVIDFPWMRVVSAAKKSTFGRGIVPDSEVDYSPEDIISKRDRDLQKALSLIK